MERAYGTSGSDPYHPALLLSVLVYGYATGVFSSRRWRTPETIIPVRTGTPFFIPHRTPTVPLTDAELLAALSLACTR